jgi:hypothetical protein
MRWHRIQGRPEFEGDKPRRLVGAPPISRANTRSS